MAKWLEQASQWHEMYCHDLKAMSSNPGQVELEVFGTTVLSRTWIKIFQLALLVNFSNLGSNKEMSLSVHVHQLCLWFLCHRDSWRRSITWAIVQNKVIGLPHLSAWNLQSATNLLNLLIFSLLTFLSQVFLLIFPLGYQTVPPTFGSWLAGLQCQQSWETPQIARVTGLHCSSVRHYQSNSVQWDLLVE